MSCSRSAVVRANIEALVPQMTHYLQLVLRHCSKGVISVSFPFFRLARIAITSKVGQYDTEVLRQTPGDFVPDDMRLRITFGARLN